MCGVGFSGKSTLAKKIAEYTHATLVSQDSMFFEKEKELSLNLDNDKQWEMVLSMCITRIKEELTKGNSAVFDDTSLRVSHRDKLREIAEDADSETKVIFLNTPIETQKERQERNKITAERHDVKQEYLDQAIAELEIPGNDENTHVFEVNMNVEEFLKTL
jgi:predicted kinase